MENGKLILSGHLFSPYYNYSNLIEALMVMLETRQLTKLWTEGVIALVLGSHVEAAVMYSNLHNLRHLQDKNRLALNFNISIKETGYFKV